MSTVSTHKAKAQFLALVERVLAGEEVVITEGDKPIARLVPYGRPVTRRRELGLMHGQIWMADDFDAPLPEGVLATFVGVTG